MLMETRLDALVIFDEYPVARSAAHPARACRRSKTFQNMPSTLQARRPRVEQLPVARHGVSLRQLLAHSVHGVRPPDVRVTSCTSDWRQVRPGDVYVAITGANEDGHDFATKAVSRGAAAIICERQLPVFEVPQCVVADSRIVYGELCQALVGNPARQLKIIGVTGTHGKTTVS